MHTIHSESGSTTILSQYLQVPALRPTELLEVEVEHDSHSGGHLWPQERLPDLHGQVMKGGERLSGQCQIGPALPLVLCQLVQTRLL